MTPFFFGTASRRLFGVYTPAHGGRAEPQAAVLCQPLGQEYLRAHRSVRHLAVLLARAGVHVLRFDYFGSGDSGGDLADADLAGWRDDVEAALDELKDITGAARVGVAGLRIGGSLAAAVAARRPDVDRVALWDPVIDGREYLHALGTLGGGSIVGPCEVEGFVLGERLTRDLEALDLREFFPLLPARTLVVASDTSSLDNALRASLTANPGGPVPLEEIPGPRPWIEERSTGVGAIPAELVQRIVAWWTGERA
jgi:pimeloyl-ACP methyl ester carboxylesterase